MARLSDLPIGAKVKDTNTKYAGMTIIWIIADKNHRGYPSNTVTLISEKTQSEETFDYNEKTYEDSKIRKWLNDANGLMKGFSNNFKNAIVDTNVSTTDNGSVIDKVFLASKTEVGLEEESEVGNKFPIFTDVKSRVTFKLNGSNTYWWTRTVDFSGSVVCIQSDGRWYGRKPNQSAGARPLCNLKSDINVSDRKDSDGAYTIIWNQPPIIESTTSTNMGTKSSGFSFTYKVTEKDAGQSLTVEDYVDNSRTKQFSASSGSTYTFSLSRTAYQKLLNGNHTIKIVAKDNQGGVAKKVFNFSKNETKILFTLEKPLVADAMVTRAMLNVIGSIPNGAILKVEACNNGNDPNPTWEDCTEQTLGHRKIFLRNKQKTAINWGFNVRVSVDRNGATGECYISSIGGNFE